MSGPEFFSAWSNASKFGVGRPCSAHRVHLRFYFASVVRFCEWVSGALQQVGAAAQGRWRVGSLRFHNDSEFLIQHENLGLGCANT